MQREIRQEYRYNQPARKLARKLGWFSIGLGVAQVCMPGVLSRSLGIPGASRFMRMCGVREIVTGVGLLMTHQPKPWIKARVAGDSLDLAALGSAMLLGNKPLRAAIAAGTVAGVSALDMHSLKGLVKEDTKVTIYDYSDRSGFPETPDKMRGRASANGSIHNLPQLKGIDVATRETEPKL
jgi:hypothetical protein